MGTGHQTLSTESSTKDFWRKYCESGRGKGQQWDDERQLGGKCVSGNGATRVQAAQGAEAEAAVDKSAGGPACSAGAVRRAGRSAAAARLVALERVVRAEPFDEALRYAQRALGLRALDLRHALLDF